MDLMINLENPNMSLNVKKKKQTKQTRIKSIKMNQIQK